MTFPEILMLGVVLLVTAFAWRNVTAAALGVYYLIAQAAWLLGLEITPIIYLMLDVTVISVIYCKPPVYDCYPYRGWRHQLCALWLERSIWDRIVILAFFAEWPFYILDFGAANWWALYWLTLAQFLAAGGERLSYLRSAKADTMPDDSSSGLLFTAGAERLGYG